MHIQTYSQDGGFHIDDNGKNKYTFCLYINNIEGCFDEQDINKKEELMEISGGEFLIKIPNRKEILCIETLSNRGIFFPSEYLHKGMAFNRFIPDYRLCLTWKLEINDK